MQERQQSASDIVVVYKGLGITWLKQGKYFHIFNYLLTPFLKGSFAVKSPFDIHLMRAFQFKILYAF